MSKPQSGQKSAFATHRIGHSIGMSSGTSANGWIVGMSRIVQPKGATMLLASVGEHDLIVAVLVLAAIALLVFIVRR